ncbi:hypothetical protein CEXT_436521 [Caerostris extrusa]|uniref:Uncharacterized protein n=1 Tax=Caerostris extrusa TaxID=172846 RepID=A0AAV4M7V5_CAEEX|nr:hypothetical protein CEXT_436521 [Caerostris extrusa]
MLEILFRIGPETCSGQEKAKSPLRIDRKRTMSSQNSTGFLIDRSTSQRVHWGAPKIPILNLADESMVMHIVDIASGSGGSGSKASSVQSEKLVLRIGVAVNLFGGKL